MGFHRLGQPAAVTALLAEELAHARNNADPFQLAHDCRNPAGHDFISSCGDVVCVHCGRVAWS